MLSVDDGFVRATEAAGRRVARVARAVSDRTEDVEDLTQETYLAAWRAWRGDRRPRSVEPWLASICRNQARSERRRRARRGREVSLEGVDLPDERSGPEAETIAILEREALGRALRRLPEEQRRSISLVHLAGHSASEAALIMGTPRGTVLSRLHRGRRALAVALRDELGGVRP